MLERHARLILDDVYASWEQGDLPSTLSYSTEDVEFAVHSAPDAASLIGAGHGRSDFGDRLEIVRAHVPGARSSSFST